jgi:hypothetical protein
MTPLVFMDLGTNGLRWVRDSLSNGGDFSHAAEIAVAIEKGHAYTYVPADVQDPDLGQILFFPGDRYPMEDAWESERRMGALIAANFRGLLLSESGAERSEFERGMWKGQIAADHAVFVGKSVVEWYELHQAAKDLGSFLGNLSHGDNAFILTDVSLRFRPQEDISARLPQLAGSVEAVLVGAFDAVSYILWTSRKIDVTEPVTTEPIT